MHNFTIFYVTFVSIRIIDAIRCYSEECNVIFGIGESYCYTFREHTSFNEIVKMGCSNLICNNRHSTKNTPSHRRRSFNPVETEAIMKLSMCFPFDTSMRLMNISIIAKCSSFYHRRHHLHVKSQSSDPGQTKNHNGVYRNNETHGRTVTVRRTLHLTVVDLSILLRRKRL
ncbi:hypothetical protein DICVIV_09058 [Dictyocaulus viviparus]|uniref:Uncharacterized protein n=1 Tax=Dictyocaulus viviparus TaxID=29172 RepID=A0A0D8XJY5_DICVI|nr:hypothetical protein DICVIV_09058 [Dictyocaulus viviparus]